jgi:hypothetical protein
MFAHLAYCTYPRWLIDDNDFLEQLVEWIWQGKPKYSEETCPGATLFTTKSHMTSRSRTPDRSGGKPATNRLSYGAAIIMLYFSSLTILRCSLIFTASFHLFLSYSLQYEYFLSFSGHCVWLVDSYTETVPESPWSSMGNLLPDGRASA